MKPIRSLARWSAASLSALLQWLMVSLLVSGSLHAQDADRIALVIGNGAYADAPLKNPPNDARLIAATLRDLGFDVIERIDVDQISMKRAVQEFADRLESGDKDSVGLVYYAGHGIQVGGENFLIPVNASISRESDVAIEAVSASGVLSVLDFARNHLNIVIMDACRNNPYARSFRSASRGLARMDAPQGTLIAYATAPGDVARDGDADNSPYTAALAREMRVPGVPVEQMFKEVRRQVATGTGGMQIPWEASSLIGDFYFQPTALIAPVTETEAVVDEDTSLWLRIKDSRTIRDFEDYLARFPDGSYAAVARNKLLSLAAVPSGPDREPTGVDTPDPEVTLIADTEIRAATFVALDLDAFPRLSAADLPSKNVLFVATDGADDSRGTVDQPLASLAGALRRAGDGTTIVVRGGEYREAYENGDFRALVIERDDLTLMAHPGERVIVRPAPGVNHGMVVNARRLSVRGINLDGFSNVGILFEPGAVRNRHVVIADLSITGSDEAIAMWDAAGAVDELLIVNVRTDAIVHCGVGPCKSWRLENVTVKAAGEGWGADAFAVEAGDNILVVNLTVSGAGSDGIDIKATRAVVLNSSISGARNNAIKLEHGGDVINSVILRGSESPIVVEQGRFRLINSTIGYAPPYDSLRDYSMIFGYDRRRSMQIEIVNSIIANASGAVWINPESSSVSIRNTLFFSGDGSEILIHGDFEAGYRDRISVLNARYGTGNLATDPMLDPGLRPDAGSPAIDAGITLSTNFPSIDREGNPRVRGYAADLGAFELPSQ